MKQFDLQTYLAHPEKKVVTRDGKSARIICTDKFSKENYPIVALIHDGEREFANNYNPAGRCCINNYDDDLDLFFVDEEEPLTEFEWKLAEWMYSGCDIEGMIDGEGESGVVTSTIKHAAKELLELARKELVKEGTSKNEMGTMLYDAGFEDGKEEALKDLPRWKKCDTNTIYNTKFNLVENGVGRFLMVEGHQIDIDSLEKLPGFNE